MQTFSNLINDYIYKFKTFKVTTRTLQQWEMMAAFPYLSENFKFQASLRQAADFKARHKIRQRKVTKFDIEMDMETLEETVEAAEKFQKQTKKLISMYIPHFVINIDQTGCNYQTTD